MLGELAESVIQRLKREKYKIATAESCTGGMLAQYITSVSGASEVFELGEITYANHMKEQELGVSPSLLNEFGAVSKSVCEQMAEGIRLKALSDIGIGVTGIAGPNGGTTEKPVGTVYVGIAHKNGTDCRLLQLHGDRREIREATVKQVFIMLKNILDSN